MKAFMKEVVLPSVGNVLKLIVSKRSLVMVAGGVVIALNIIQTPIALICMTILGVTYIISETIKKS